MGGNCWFLLRWIPTLTLQRRQSWWWLSWKPCRYHMQNSDRL